MNTIKQFLKIKFPILIKTKYFIRSVILRNKLNYIELHIADSCNLNCKSCTHFANISKKNNFIDARILGNSLHRLNELFTLERIRLLGGEPLLHPDIINVLKATRQFLPCSSIELVTNGLLLNKMSKEFFETCNENGIKIIVSVYPVLKNKEEIEKILSSFKINYEFFPMVFTFTANLNPNGTSDKKEIFKNCKHNYCRTLKNDNIYICPICTYIDKYNEYFNKNIPTGKGINIFAYSAKQIFKYLKEPEETCKYCTNITEYVDWSCGTPKETDWNGKI